MSLPRTAASPILIVDDDPGAVVLLRRLLVKAGISNPVEIAADGAVAIAYLQRALTASPPAHPALVLLDLHMPNVDGFEVLEWVRKVPSYQNLLVAVVSSSREPDAAKRAYALGARSYFSKFPVVSDLQSVYNLGNAILTVEELGQLADQTR